MMNRTKTRRRTQRSGAAVVEMALTLPILLLILFGCYEFARANMMRHAAEAAAYEGARVGITPGATPQDVTNAAGFILSTVGVNNFTVNVTPSPITPQSPTIRVTVTLDMADNTVLVPFFNKDASFTGACELTREGL